MGFFDRLTGKSKPTAPSTPAPASAASAGASAAGPTGGLLPQLVAAREKLESGDHESAFAAYEETLAASGDRPDVLVTISADLGTNGQVEKIIELIAPRYDAERHGPATGVNLLQAYLAVRDATAAQHTLDILFSLQRPELEERLWGFSNAIAELLEAQRRGRPAPAGPAGAPPEAQTIGLVTISKPIWSYGLDSVPGVLPAKEGRARRIAFAQLSTPGLPDLEKRMQAPEDDLGRLVRGFPLWLMETAYYCPHYSPIAAVGLFGRSHFALFPTDWSADNLRQIVESTSGGLDYIFTGSIHEQSGDYELVLRLWEVKKFRERKAFTARWTPATADAELAKLHEQLRLFLEISPYPAGAAIPCPPPARPSAWLQQLGTSLNLFLADKAVLSREQVVLPGSVAAEAAASAADSEIASLHALTLARRAAALGLDFPAPATLHPSPVVATAQAGL